MEILLFVTALAALGLLAVRFGRDSRDTLRSSEQVLADLGLAWDGKPADLPTSRAAAPRRPARPVHPLRHYSAAVLYRLADWLYPGVNDPRRLPQRTTSMY